MKSEATVNYRNNGKLNKKRKKITLHLAYTHHVDQL